MENLPTIPQDGTLRDWQSYVGEHVRARGWDRATDLEVFLLFSEEVGELAKAFRRHRELFQETFQEVSQEQKASTTKAELASEMADVLSYLLDLAQRMDIDLQTAATEKELANRSRAWDY